MHPASLAHHGAVRVHGWIGCAFFLISVASTGWAGPAVVINEVYYDHPGADSGHEFVELWNASAAAVDLAGWRLQAGDGAGPSRWRSVWQGNQGDVVAPRSRFMIGEAEVVPAPDRAATLGLENGPDAVRLVAPDGTADVVGWGGLSYAEYFEGSPAADVEAGYSLARLTDGLDTGDNLHDFGALTPPTPGASNRPEIDAALIARDPLCLPELVEPGQPIAARGTLLNRGVAALAAPDLRLLLWCAAAPSLVVAGSDSAGPGLAPDSLVAEIGAADPLEPGDSLSIGLEWSPPGAGVYRLALVARAAEDGVPANDRAEGYVRAGVGPLVLNEICYAPKAGEPEWVEVRTLGGAPVDLSVFALEDASGRAGRVDPGRATFLAPESLAVLTEDAPSLLARHPNLDPTRVLTLSPWPALNNSARAAGEPADRIVLRDARGAPSDAVAYEGGGSPGATLERREAARLGTDPGNWGASAFDGGTPLAPNSILVPPGAGVRLALSPRVWRTGAGEPHRLRVAYRLAWERALVRVSVIDARGRERSRLADGPSGPSGDIEWDGRAAGGERLPPGAYLLALVARPQEGAGRLRLTEPLLVLP